MSKVCYCWIFLFLRIATFAQDIPELKIPLGHSGRINGVALSADNKFIVTGGEDNMVITWEARTGREIRKFSVGAPILQLYLTSDSKYIYTLSGNDASAMFLDNHFQQWDYQKGKLIKNLPFTGMTDSKLSGNGRYLLIHNYRDSTSPKDNNSRFFKGEMWAVWDLELNKKISLGNLSPASIIVAPQFIEYDHVQALMTPRYNISAGRITGDIFDIWRLDDLEKGSFPPSPLRSIVIPAQVSRITAAGNYLATISQKNLLQVWSSTRDSALYTFPGNLEPKSELVFSPDGNFLLLYDLESKQPSVRLINTLTGDSLLSMKLEYPQKGYFAGLSPDGSYFLLGELRAPDIYTGKGAWIARLQGHCHPVMGEGFSDNGQWIMTDFNGSLNAINKNPASDKFLNSLHEQMIDLIASSRGLIFSPAQRDSVRRVLQLSETRHVPQLKVRAWDLYNGEVKTTVPEDLSLARYPSLKNGDLILQADTSRSKMKNSMKAMMDFARQRQKESPLPGQDQSIRLSSMLIDSLVKNNTRTAITFVRNIHSGERVALIALDSVDWVMVADDGYYMASKNGAKLLYYLYRNELYSFDQFDLKYNRPDKILEKIGLASPSRIATFRKYYQKRLEILGFDTTAFDRNFLLNTPKIRILNMDKIPVSTTSPDLSFTVSLKDSLYTLDRVNVYINGAPIYGIRGYDLSGSKTKNTDKKFQVALTPGKNIIEVSVLNIKGVESLKERMEVTCTAMPAKTDLYLFFVAADKYAKGGNLVYPAQDADSITRFFKSRSSYYNKVFTYVLKSGDVTIENILRWKEILNKTSINDRVILFYAGHGKLLDNSHYYLGTYNIDFSHPEGTGLLYEDFEGLLDGIPSRKKVIFIDACFSGEADGQKKTNTIPGAVSFNQINPATTEGQLQEALSWERLKELFPDIRKGNGATIISAAGGMEQANESTAWNNGAFTHCLLEAFRTFGQANPDRPVRLSALQDFVRKCVPELTNNKQHPTSRKENLVADFDF